MKAPVARADRGKQFKGTGSQAGTTQRQKSNAAAAARVNAALAAAASGTPPTPTDVARFELTPLELARTRRRHVGEPVLPTQAQHNVVLHTPGGKLVQKRHLPNAAQPAASASTALFGQAAAAPDPYAKLLPFENGIDTGVFHFGPSMSPEPESRHRRRRQKQYQNWHELISERFMRLYLDQKHGIATPIRDVSCECRRRRLTVMLADWDSSYRRFAVSVTDVDLGSRVVQIWICACTPAAEQLLAMGYFPCAPRGPSIAFSTALLDFISIHSLNVAPNITAWAETLQTFWARRGHESNAAVRDLNRPTARRRILLAESFAQKTPVRKRLGSAMTWFQALDNRAETYVTTLIARACA